MKTPATRRATRSFDLVGAIGLTLPRVKTGIRYDGSPRLTLGGCFLAGLATHRSAEPDSLVVRCAPDDRARLIEDAPDSYYITDYYATYALVLARLSRVNREALHDLLSVSWRLTALKARR